MEEITGVGEAKLEEQLRMALETPYSQRELTLDLNSGYDEEDDTWELIVRYYDSLDAVREALDVRIVTLLNNYAVILIREEDIPRLVEFPQVLYVENPKRYFFSVEQGRNVSCIDTVQSARIPEERRLYGEGVLIAIPDSGIDYSHPDFRAEDGTTRIVTLWDQTAEYDGNRYGLGRIFTREELNVSLRDGTILSTDRSGHGTAVAGIAAGNGAASDGRYAGVAPEAELVVIKLAEGRERGFARTTAILYAVDFALRVSGSLARPLAINLSYGNSYGAHNGESLLEQFLDEAATVYRNSIVVGTGNEGSTNRHARVVFETDDSRRNEGYRRGNEARIDGEGRERIVEFVVAAGEPTLNLQIWRYAFDEVAIDIVAPSGQRHRVEAFAETQEVLLDDARLLILYGEAKPYSGQQELYIEFVPLTIGNVYDTTRPTLLGGTWQLVFTPIRILDGIIDCWLPAGGLLLEDTAFLRPSPATTLTIPATAQRVISVSAYNADNGIYAAFSGQGPGRGGERKPDLSAPGVDVYTTSPGGGYARRTGTSFAAPFVTGAAALLMEWGMVQGNDPAFYGEKVKSALIAGARPLPGITAYPDPQVGWGALCLGDSVPRNR